MFNVGDKVVYPMHGAGVIQDIEEKNILGEKTSYYIIKMPGEVKVMVPTSKAEEVGMRNIIDVRFEETIQKILGFIQPAFFVLIALCIIGAYLSLLLPIYSMIDLM